MPSELIQVVQRAVLRPSLRTGLRAAALSTLLAGAVLAHGGIVPNPEPPPPPPTPGGGQYKAPGDAGGGATSGSSAGSAGGAATSGAGLRRRSGAGSTAAATGSAGVSRLAGVRGGSGRAGASTGAAWSASQPSPDGWTHWWAQNRDRFLDLRGGLDRSTTVSGSPVLLTGRGRRNRARLGQRVDDWTLRDSIVPALLEVLTSSDDRERLDSALVALARSAPRDLADEALAACVPLLAHRELSVQAAAALALGVLQRPAGTELLLALARDDSAGRQAVGGGPVPTRVRAHAAFAAGVSADGRTVHSLLRIVRDLPASERELAACALSGLGMDGHSRANAVVATVLTEMLDDRRLDPAVAATIPTALARLGVRASLDRLVACLTDRDADLLVKQSAALALGTLAQLDDEAARDELLTSVRHGRDRLTRHFALLSLGQMGASSDWSPAHDGLLAELTDEIAGRGADRAHRSWAALSLALLTRPHADAQPAALAVLRQAFDDESDPEYQGAFAVSLGLLADSSMGGVLEQHLRSVHDDQLAGALAEALGLLRHAAVTDVLQELCSDPGSTDSLRLSASMALGLIGDPEAVPVLLDTLATTHSLGVRAASAKALGLIGDRSAVQPLVALSADDSRSEASRAFACIALGLLCERTRLPFLEPLKANGHYLLPVDSLQELLAIL